MGIHLRTYSRALLGAHGTYWSTVFPSANHRAAKTHRSLNNCGLRLLPSDGQCATTTVEPWLQMGTIVSGTGNLAAIKWSDISTIQVSQKLGTSCGPPSEQTTLPRARELVSPLPVSPLDKRVVVPTQLLYSSITRRGWRHGGCSSQSPQHSSQEKSRSARLDSTDVLNSFVVGSAVANSSSAYFSLLTTERVHTRVRLQQLRCRRLHMRRSKCLPCFWEF